MRRLVATCTAALVLGLLAVVAGQLGAAAELAPAARAAAVPGDEVETAATWTALRTAAASPAVASLPAEFPSTAAGAPATTVQVRDEAGLPQVGAEVYGAIAGAPPTAPAHTGLMMDPQAVDLAEPLRPATATVRTDAQGRCELPLGGAQWLVARSGDRYGARRVLRRQAEDSRVLDLVVHPDRTLVVHTVDARGEAVGGVPIGCERDAAHGVAPLPRWLAATDASGELVIPHAQRWQRGRPLRLRALIPGASAAVTAVDLAEPLAGPVQIVVPALGSLQVVVTGPDGRPLADAEVAVLGLERARTDAEGRCVFPRIATGGNLQIRASAPGRTASVDCPGPAVGQRVTARIALTSPVVQLTGRLVTANGRPERPSRLQLRDAGPGFDSAVVSSAADGRFTIVLPGTAAGQLLAKAHLELLAVDGRLLGPRAQLPPIALQLGANSLGDLVLATPRTLVAGTIVGAPAAATCSYRLEIATADGWLAQDDFEIEPSPAGSFVLRGPDPSRPLRLFVDVRGFATAGPFPFVVGERGLVVRPELGGSLDVKLEPGVPRRLRLVRAGAADGEIAMASTAVFQDGDATFRWSCLPQGAYRLEVLSPLNGQIEFLVPDIYVFPGTKVDDARLSPRLRLPG